MLGRRTTGISIPHDRLVLRRGRIVLSLENGAFDRRLLLRRESEMVERSTAANAAPTIEAKSSVRFVMGVVWQRMGSVTVFL
jgi:hypothetical protein